MNSEKKEVPLVADVDGRFVDLRADVRDQIREAELFFRSLLEENILEKLDPVLAAVLRPLMATELPAGFIRGLFPLYKMLSDTHDQLEALHGARSRPGAINN